MDFITIKFGIQCTKWSEMVVSAKEASGWARGGWRRLVEGASALRRTAQTGDLLVFQRKLVVVSDFLVHTNRLLWIYHNLLLALNGNDLCVTVRLEQKCFEVNALVLSHKQQWRPVVVYCPVSYLVGSMPSHGLPLRYWPLCAISMTYVRVITHS